MNPKHLLIGICMLLTFSLSAHAQTTAQRMDRLEKTIAELQSALLEARAEIAEMKQARGKSESGVEVSTSGGLKVKDKSKGNEFEFSGRLMYDYDFFDDVFTDNGESQSEGEWRRTRITASGKVKNDWKYKFTINVDDQDEAADVNTAYLQYTGFDPLAITIGKFKEPFSLERLTSSKWISAIERSMLQDFLGGNLGAGQSDTGGVQISGYHEEASNLNWAIGVFDDGSEDEDGEDNYGFTGRITMTPYFGDNHFLHLGAAYSMREIEDRVRYRSRLGVHTADDGRPTFADAYVDDVDQFGLEFAYVNGRFSLQSEYMDVSADGGDIHKDPRERKTTFDEDLDGACYADTNNSGEADNGDLGTSCDDIDFDGYYVQAAYTLTGETRGYETKGAKFDKIEPSGDFGAWELVARYEDVDVDNDNVDKIAGNGETYDAEKLVVGINWYVNKNVKFMLNYIDAEVDKELAQGEDDKDDDGDAVSFRAQYVW